MRKYRGSLPICVGKYITDRLVERDDIEDSLVFISSCQPKPGCMDAVKAGLKKYGSFKECHETDIGTTIGGYSGPGTIGIVFARKENKKVAVAHATATFSHWERRFKISSRMASAHRPCSSGAAPGCRRG